MSAATAPDIRVAAELWTSFVSLLRSYSAAASLNGTPHEVTDRGDGFVAVQAGTERLSLMFRAERATVACIAGGACGCTYFSEEFTFLEDGSMSSTHGMQELDDVVIELLRKLSNPPTTDSTGERQ